MKIAFVGVQRKYKELDSTYIDYFNRYHLELPYYFARDGANEVVITTVDEIAHSKFLFNSGGSLCTMFENDFISLKEKFDIIVHWRKWFDKLYKQEAINLINCQDHSFDSSWQLNASKAFNNRKLHGILCFSTWHKRNLLKECKWLSEDRALDGVTLGVDTDIYHPTKKDPYKLLWASDPGRGLAKACNLVYRLFQLDKRFRLHICYPDYVKDNIKIDHPALVFHRNLKNDEILWDLFNTSGILPYTSIFCEPSSRAHRQAQAAGCMVLYPPNMGSPSELIIDDVTGIVKPISCWVNIIFNAVRKDTWSKLGNKAREFAVKNNWSVQANNFNNLMRRLLNEKNCL